MECARCLKWTQVGTCIVSLEKELLDVGSASPVRHDNYICRHLEEALRATIVKGHWESCQLLLQFFGRFSLPMPLRIYRWVQESTSNGHTELVLKFLLHPRIVETIPKASNHDHQALDLVFWACSNDINLSVVFLLVKRKPDVLSSCSPLAQQEMQPQEMKLLVGSSYAAKRQKTEPGSDSKNTNCWLKRHKDIQADHRLSFNRCEMTAPNQTTSANRHFFYITVIDRNQCAYRYLMTLAPPKLGLRVPA